MAPKYLWGPSNLGGQVLQHQWRFYVGAGGLWPPNMSLAPQKIVAPKWGMGCKKKFEPPLNGYFDTELDG